MSLLDTASLIVTPSAYKEGKLYSVIPSDGSGDLSVTRATTATRVNSAGLVELVPYNLLSYSERFENAAWTNVNSSEVANATTAPNGTLTADNLIPSATTAQHGTLQAATLNALSQYTYSIYFKPNGYTAAILRLTGSTIWGPTDGIVVSFETATMTTTLISGTPTTTFTSVGDGWYRCSVTATTIASGSSNAVVYAKEYSPYLGDGTSGLFIWGAQLNEGTLKDYFATETRLNIPRLDYSLGSCPSLLVEPQRTNLALRSQEFDNASWVKVNTSVTANTTASPDGITNADSLVENTATNLHLAFQFFTSVSLATYSFSCYIKPETRTRAYLRSDTSVGTRRTLFDLTGAGSVVTLSHDSATITAVGNGWYRATITFSEVIGLGSRLVAIEGAVGTNINYTGNGLTAFYLYGAQLEAGAYPTSYIPTTSASVTRNADLITRSVTQDFSGDWTIFLDSMRLANNLEFQTNNGYLYYYGGTNYIQLVNGTPGTLRLKIGNSTNVYTPNNSVTQGVRFKWLAKKEGSEIKLFLNGALYGTSTTLANGFTNLQIGNLTAFPINSLVEFTTAITDAQCISLTTI